MAKTKPANSLILSLYEGMQRASLIEAFGGPYWPRRTLQLIDPLLVELAMILQDEGLAPDIKTALFMVMRLRALDDLYTEGQIISDIELSPSGWARVARCRQPLEFQLRGFAGWRQPRIDDPGYPMWDWNQAQHELDVMASLVRLAWA